MSLGTFDRTRSLQQLGDTHFDVLVIGGGITGAGVALDAASRGLRTALVERDDFASGTSSKSSKLVHGGLRYLQNGDVRLVYEALRERQRLRHNAPHLVRLLPFLIPIFSKDGLINPKVARALGSAMWMYDLTGGARIGKLHKRLDRAEAVAHMPTLPEDRLAGAYLYYDAAADDARLTLTLVRTAVLDHGAVAANHANVVGLLHDGEHAAGAVVEADGQRIEVRARSVVNAAGVWSDEVRSLDEGGDPDSIRPAKGIHITVPWEKVRNDIAVVVPVPKDKRSVFVVPWLPTDDGGFELTYIGTTDTDYDGPIDDPQCTADDVAYLLKAINFSVREPLVRGGRGRHLGRAAAAGEGGVQRPHRRPVAAPPGHPIGAPASSPSPAGSSPPTERWPRTPSTSWWSTSTACRVPPAGHAPPSLKLRGAQAVDPTATGLTRHLADRYGTEARVLHALIDEDPSLGEPLVPGLPYVRAEAVYAARHEMATTVDDVLARRTRARLQARGGLRPRRRATSPTLMAPELGWSSDEAADARPRPTSRSSTAERDAPGLLPTGEVPA